MSEHGASAKRGSLLRRLALMGSSTAFKLGAGVLTFVLMARLLGVHNFGTLMLWLSVAALISLVGNFGFATLLLKEIGATPQRAAELISAVVTAKLLVTAVLVGFTLTVVSWYWPQMVWLFLPLLLAQMADTFTEVFVVGLRANGQFNTDAQLTTFVSVIQLIVVGAAVWFFPNMHAAAAAFAASRLVALIATMWVVGSRLPGIAITGWRRAIDTLVAAKAFAVDVVLQSLMGQIDSLVLNAYLGPAAVGVYQAGLRLFNGLAQVAPVLANVLLPQVSSTFFNNRSAFGSESRRVQWVFMLAGLGFGLSLAVLAGPITHHVFGAEFALLQQLLPWFGLLFFVRMFAASWGILLTATGQQGFRAKCNFVMWLVIGSACVPLVPRFESAGWLMALVLGHVLLSMMYMRRVVKTTSGGWAQSAAALASVGVFVPFLVPRSFS